MVIRGWCKGDKTESTTLGGRQVVDENEEPTGGRGCARESVDEITLAVDRGDVVEKERGV